MSEMDPAEETDADTSSERPGLDSPELEPMKQDFCRGEELRRCNMTPECDDKLRASLQPARMSWKEANTFKLKHTPYIHTELV